MQTERRTKQIHLFCMIIAKRIIKKNWKYAVADDTTFAFVIFGCGSAYLNIVLIFGISPFAKNVMMSE
jgi:hypothetical protein